MRVALLVLPVLVASSALAKGLPALPSVAIKSVTATSTYADKKDAYAAWKALIPDTEDTGDEVILRSAWCEGKPDDGIGETVTIAFAEPTQIDGLRIAAGVWRTPGLYAANNQVTAIDVIADGGKPITAKPASGRKWLDVKVGAKVTTLAFKVAAVKRAKMTDSCIAGIELIRGGQKLAPIIGVDAKAVTGLPAAFAQIMKTLGAPGHKGVETVLAFPFTQDDLWASVERGEEDAKGSAANAAAVIAACKAYDAAAKKAEESGEMVPPKGCPVGIGIDDETAQYITLRADAPGKITLKFPDHREFARTATLVYQGGSWKLQAIAFESP